MCDQSIHLFQIIDHAPGATRLVLSIKLTNGESSSREVGIVIVNGKPHCDFDADDESSGKRAEWPFTAAISSIEVSNRSARKPQLNADLAADQNSEHFDTANEQIPGWMIDVKNRKRSSRLILQALDVRGVEFVTQFPGAKSRLDNQE